ncbi:penicillin acylase family protein [Halioglobus maricola]|uniref:penicillin acylase family protein n=1 Tax=Halioglobus maricola TaxID=2601894 RepID=UPI00147967BE|nr:penicillin acylase family protein [Halioglobus maricola]
MNFELSRRLRLPIYTLACGFLIACSDSSDRNDNPVEPPVEPPLPEYTYEAEIIWTEYGIPHVVAQDWASAGYGVGYAFAGENYCTLMREYVRASGNSARYLGEEGSLNDDFVYKLYNDDVTVDRMYDSLSQDQQDAMAGYAAGVNRYFNETGAENLAEGEEGCRGAEWVREVDYRDVVRLAHKAILRGSSGPLADFSTAVTAPEALASLAPVAPEERAAMFAGLDKASVDAALDLPQGWEIGSNAYAIGADGSQTDSGLLFGNPHFPWQGSLRFFMFHLTVADEYDVMGAALGGLPSPVIGFNRDLAWSHTVSTGDRFTFYELTLNPDNPLEYEYDGEMREITSETVSAIDSSGAEVEYTFYFSHYGPIVDLGEVSPLLAGWPNAAGTLLTYRDANQENLRGFDQWVQMGKAQNLAEFKEALRPIGIPWVNTIAADRNGDAFYGDISAVPNVSIAQYGSCIRGTLQSLLTGFGYTTLEGSDSTCEWGNDADTAEGIFGYDSLPKLETREYGANANDSYWLSNPRMLLTGFSPLIGEEGVEQSMRTRHTFTLAEARLAGGDNHGADPLFNIDNLRAISYQADNFVAHLMQDDLATVCDETADWAMYSANPAQAAEACGILRDWDGSHKLESVGGHIFFEFWQIARGIENLWSVPFEVTEPVTTPAVLSEDPMVVEEVRSALGAAVDRLVEAGIALDAPWGEVQFVDKNGERIGIHGGSSRMMFSVITSDLVDGEGYSAIEHGNSYIQAITWDESECPDAYAILTYSQSTDPASAHYADATKLYSEGGWIDMPFCEAARDEQEIARESIAE